MEFGGGKVWNIVLVRPACPLMGSSSQPLSGGRAGNGEFLLQLRNTSALAREGGSQWSPNPSS